MTLPKTWTEVAIGTIAEVYGSGAQHRERTSFTKGSMPWMTLSDMTRLSGLVVESTARTLKEAGPRPASSRVLPAGTVLLSSRVKIGRTAIAAREMTTDQSFISLICDPELVSNEYLARVLRAMTPMLESVSTGSAARFISRSTVAKLRIPLPTLPEQRRIAEMLALAESLRPAEDIRAIRGSILHAALDPLIADTDLRTARLAELVEMRLGSSVRFTPSDKAESDGLPILRTANVIGGVITTDELKYARPPAGEAQRLRLHAGDMLLVRLHGNPDYVGDCAVVPHWADDTHWLYASHLIRLRLKSDAVRAEYLGAFLNSPYGRSAMQNTIRSTAGQTLLSIDSLANIVVPLPSRSAQQYFANLWGGVHDVTQRIGAARAQADTLIALLEQQAFNGTLTEKWREKNRPSIRDAARSRDKSLLLVGHGAIEAVDESGPAVPTDAQPREWIEKELSALQQNVLRALSEPAGAGIPFVSDDPDQMAEFVTRAPFDSQLAHELPTPAQVRAALTQLAALGLAQKIALRLQPAGSALRSLRFVPAYTLPNNQKSRAQVMQDLGLAEHADEQDANGGDDPQR